MGKPILKRVYWRALRFAGWKQESWDKQYEEGVLSPRVRSPHTIVTVAALCKGGTLLEFGCGEGELSQMLPPGTFSAYLGIDISEVAVQRAIKRATQAG